MESCFFIIVPAGIVTLICTWFALSGPVHREKTRFDWPGFIALSIAIIALQLIFDRGHRLDWFDSNIIIGLTFIGCWPFGYLFFIVFIHPHHS